MGLIRAARGLTQQDTAPPSGGGHGWRGWALQGRAHVANLAFLPEASVSLTVLRPLSRGAPPTPPRHPGPTQVQVCAVLPPGVYSG